MFFSKKTIKDLLPPPVRVAHGEYSMILSAEDDPSKPTPTMIETSLQAIQAALVTQLPGESAYLNLWPGEHYRLLAGFAQVLQPRLIIEIGTATGLSSLAMLPYTTQLITFDIRSWDTYPNTVLGAQDFADGRLIQKVADLGQESVFDAHRELLQKATFFFIDATHDGYLEKKLLEQIASLPRQEPAWLLFDDIRVWTMLKMWREVSHPKLDLTSFGHWSGTGLVYLS